MTAGTPSQCHSTLYYLQFNKLFAHTSWLCPRLALVKVVLFGEIVPFSQFSLGDCKNSCYFLLHSGHSHVKLAFCQMTKWNLIATFITSKIAHVQSAAPAFSFRSSTMISVQVGQDGSLCSVAIHTVA
jgi:hypothetical protein